MQGIQKISFTTCKEGKITLDEKYTKESD